MMKISFGKRCTPSRRDAHFGECAGRGADHEVGLKTKKHNEILICLNVHAVEARRPFGGIGGVGRGLITKLG